MSTALDKHEHRRLVTLKVVTRGGLWCVHGLGVRSSSAVAGVRMHV